MRVFVYHNFNKKCFSIRALDGEFKNKVIGYASDIDLIDAEFKVSETGRQNVLRTRHKNVHAGVVGNIEWIRGYIPRLGDMPDTKKVALSTTDMIPVRYNPYHTKSFQSEAGATVYEATQVALRNNVKVLVCRSSLHPNFP